MRPLTYSESRLITYFEDAVMHDRRAPSTEVIRKLGLGDPIRILASLIRMGYVESRNYGHNWRVVFIKHGPYEGQNTQMPPEGWVEHENSKRRRGAL